MEIFIFLCFYILLIYLIDFLSEKCQILGAIFQKTLYKPQKVLIVYCKLTFVLTLENLKIFDNKCIEIINYPSGHANNVFKEVILL